MVTPADWSSGETAAETHFHPSMPAMRNSYGSPPTTCEVPERQPFSHCSPATSMIPCVTWREVLTSTGCPASARTAMIRQDFAGRVPEMFSPKHDNGALAQKSKAKCRCAGARPSLVEGYDRLNSESSQLKRPITSCRTPSFSEVTSHVVGMALSKQSTGRATASWCDMVRFNTSMRSAGSSGSQSLTRKSCPDTATHEAPSRASSRETGLMPMALPPGRTMGGSGSFHHTRPLRK